MIWLQGIGSAASILGLCVSLYVLWRENKIETEVHDLRTEEEVWHDETKHSR
jgi:hypothetical protein